MKNDYIRIRLEPHMKPLLKQHAKDLGFTLSGFIRHIMRQQIPAHKVVAAQLKENEK